VWYILAMSLTTQDLDAIKGIVDTSIDDAITNRVKPMIDEAVEDLRLHTAAGFAEMDERFAQVDKRFAQVDARFGSLEQKVDRIDGELQTVKHTVTRIDHDLHELTGEVSIVNKRLERLDRHDRAHDAHFDEHAMRLGRIEKHTGLSPA